MPGIFLSRSMANTAQCGGGHSSGWCNTYAYNGEGDGEGDPVSISGKFVANKGIKLIHILSK